MSQFDWNCCTFCTLFIAVWSMAPSSVAWSADEPSSDQATAIRIDRVLLESFAPDAPDAVALVVHKGQVVLRRGYGLANLELDVKIDPAQIFRIGSLTTQFTVRIDPLPDFIDWLARYRYA